MYHNPPTCLGTEKARIRQVVARLCGQTEALGTLLNRNKVAGRNLSSEAAMLEFPFQSESVVLSHRWASLSPGLDERKGSRPIANDQTLFLSPKEAGDDTQCFQGQCKVMHVYSTLGTANLTHLDDSQAENATWHEQLQQMKTVHSAAQATAGRAGRTGASLACAQAPRLVPTSRSQEASNRRFPSGIPQILCA